MRRIALLAPAVLVLAAACATAQPRPVGGLPPDRHARTHARRPPQWSRPPLPVVDRPRSVTPAPVITPAPTDDRRLR